MELKTRNVLTLCALAVAASGYGQNLLVNPSFTNGNTGFQSSYTYFTGSPLPEGRNVIAHSPREHHPLQANFGDHTTGTGLMMVVNGGTLSNVFSYPVWQETVTVSPHTNYVFSGWTTTADSFDTSPAVLAARINGQTVMASFTVPNPGASWRQFTVSWSSAGSAAATISLFDTNTAASGNDFVLDDLSFSRSSPVPEPSAWATLSLGLLPILRRRRR